MLLADAVSVLDSPALAAWGVITCLIGLVWLKRHVDFNRGRDQPVLRPDEPGLPDDELPSLSVVVSAKDEQDNIGRCLAGLLAQDYPRLQVVVVDDRSSDRTGQIIDEFAARDSRVSAVHVSDLPAGWFGKNNAMRAGVARAEGQWLCFSDADCTYDSPRLLSAALRYALRERIDFLSVLPRLEAGSFWERVVQPVAGAIMVFWFPPHKVNDPRAPHAYANGAFMLMSRRAYATIGGHEAVRDTLNEDMHMARLAKAAGLRLRVLRGELYRVRMYVGLRAIWRGWSRIFYGCFGTLRQLLVSVLMLAVFSLSPYVTLLAGVAVREWWLVGAAGFAVIGQQSVLWRFYHVTGAGAGWALSYPLGAALCLAMTLNAIRRVGGTPTTWRGTTYRGGGQTQTEHTGCESSSARQRAD